MNRIDNWPPGYYEPTGFIEPPPGLLRKIEELQDALDERQAELALWIQAAEERKSREWVAYHDANGWPDDDHGYRQRLLHAANR